jgi:Protein of unknown function (DUF3467)
MDEQNKQSTQNVQVKISDEVLKGLYSNNAQISHSPEEFILDFMNILPPTGIVSSRIIVSPSHFKRLLLTMQDNLKKYEEEFGTVSLAVVPDQKIGFKTE